MKRRHFLHRLTDASALMLGPSVTSQATRYGPWNEYTGADDLMKHKIADISYTDVQLKLKTNYNTLLTGGLGNTVTIEGVPCNSDDIDFVIIKSWEGN